MPKLNHSSAHRGGSTPSPRERQVWFVDHARSGRFPNTASLAAHCGVSRATAKRDIAHLVGELGAPLRYLRAQRGYALADPGWRMGDSSPRLEHTLALATARRLLEGVSPALALDLSAAIERSDTVAADPAYDKVLYVSGSRDAGRGHPCLRALLDACVRRRRLSFHYAAPWSDAPAERRVVSPWVVHLHDGRLYLHGYCHARRDARCFSLAHIADLRFPGGRALAEPRGFRLELAGALGVASGTPQWAEVALFGGLARYAASECWHPRQEDRWEGEVLIRRFPYALLAEAVRRLLCCGGEIEVITPLVLREALEAAFLAGARRNGPRGGGAMGRGSWRG